MNNAASLFFCCLVLGNTCNCVTVQAQGPGLVGSEKAEAETFLANLAADAQLLPRTFSVVTRMDESIVRSKGTTEKSDLEHIYLYATEYESRVHQALYVAREFHQDFDPNRIWRQQIRRTRRIYDRMGRDFEKDRLLTWDSEDDGGKKTRGSLIERIIHPFFLPVAHHRNDQHSVVDREYGMKLLSMLTLLDASHEKNGLLKSRWSYWDGQREVEIYFDRKMGNRPTKIIHFQSNEQLEPEAEEKRWLVESVHMIVWDEQEFGEEPTIWVPVEFQRSTNLRIFKRETERHGILVWSGETETSAIADPEDNSWTEPMRQIFNENWRVGFDDFAQAWKQQRKK